jgi:cysteine desulfurase
MTHPPPIYLDYAATTPLDPRVAEAMREAMLGYANPASQHQAGRAARKGLEEAREQIARSLGAKADGIDADRLIFTSGGTEANNLALFGLTGRTPCRLLVSAIEHPSVSMAADELARRGYQVERMPVDPNGVLDLDHLHTLLQQSPAPKLVSVMLANNETGAVQPVAQVAALCKQHHTLLHTDAVQAIGKCAVNFTKLDVDAMTIAPHKFYGPIGIGALLLHDDTPIEPQLFGGFQQGGLRPGTESFPLVAGFGEALQNVVEDQLHASRLNELRDAFERGLRQQLDDVVINGEGAQRLPHISNTAFLGRDRQQLFLALDFEGIYCSTGSACASGSSEPSPVLRAMGLPEEVISSSLRFSFGSPTTRDEIDEAVERIVKCVKRLRSQKSARK